MKTAEDLTKDFVAGFMSAHTEDYVINSIKQIQLDAMKEGMRRAAIMVAYASSCHDVSIIDEFRLEKQQAILTAAEQLTKKDL